MRIRKKVLASALITTGIALVVIKTGDIILGLSLLMISLSIHLIHFMLYLKKVP